MAIIEIDKESGFCFGVVTAIRKAEEQLEAGGRLYCLGDIVHNSDEVERLRGKGLETITHEEMADLRGARVLLRAHGEPPSTYRLARERDIDIIDATCPVVLKLQQRIKAAYQSEERPQIVIYGKAGHAEVNGLVGQTDGTAIVVDDTSSLAGIDFSRPIALYSQTTKSLDGFHRISDEFRRRAARPELVECHDTICRQVANRMEKMREFAGTHEVVIFVSGAKSSNGKVLYEKCREVNPRTYLIYDETQLDPSWTRGAETVGICGATSTPLWLMERVKDALENEVADGAPESAPQG